MAWIRVIEEKEAQGRLQELYSSLLGPGGKIDNILKIHSLNPASLQGHLGLYKALMWGRSPLSRAQREMIAVTVSALNQCHY